VQRDDIIVNRARLRLDRQNDVNNKEAGKLGWEKSKELNLERGRQRTQKAIDEYEANPKFCLFCETKLPFEKRRGKFCNQTCSAKHNNRGVTRHIKGSKICQCGKSKKPHNKYCADCIKNRVYAVKIERLEDAKYDRMRRRLLIEQRGNRCEVCGFEEWNGKPIPIELDHIDGNSDNNTEANLRLICPNCHAQTETYKGGNKGRNSKRQQFRRKRYSDGLTY
jgi:hypothetical protein